MASKCYIFLFKTFWNVYGDDFFRKKGTEVSWFRNWNYHFLLGKLYIELVEGKLFLEAVYRLELFINFT